MSFSFMIRCQMSKSSNLFKALCILSSMTHADVDAHTSSVMTDAPIRTQLTEADLLYEFTMPIKIIAETHAKTHIHYHSIYYILAAINLVLPYAALKYIDTKQGNNRNGLLLVGLTIGVFTGGFLLRNVCKNAYARYFGNLFICTSILLSSLALSPLIREVGYRVRGR